LRYYRKWYIPRFDEKINELTVESKIDKRNNNYTVNIIPYFVSESKEIFFIIQLVPVIYGMH
jgi:hypothetical protein